MGQGFMVPLSHSAWGAPLTCTATSKPLQLRAEAGRSGQQCCRGVASVIYFLNSFLNGEHESYGEYRVWFASMEQGRMANPMYLRTCLRTAYKMCKAPHTCIYICIHRGYLVFWLVVVFFMCWMALWQGPGGQVGAACCMPSTGKMPILGDINRCQSWVLAFLMFATKTRRRKEKVFVITFHS